MWLSRVAASSLSDIANAILIGALVVGVVATYLVVWAGNSKEEYLKVDIADANERAARAGRDAAEARKDTAAADTLIAEARKEAASATATAKEFEARIAEANARAAEANEKAEAERLARVRIEERLAPRTISKVELQNIATIVSASRPQTLDIFMYPNDPEAHALTLQLLAAFQAAEWSATVFQPLGSGNVSGTLVEFDPHDKKAATSATLLRDALKLAGLAVMGPSATLPTPQGRLPAYLGPDNASVGAPLRLTVGRK